MKAEVGAGVEEGGIRRKRRGLTITGHQITGNRIRLRNQPRLKAKCRNKVRKISMN